MPAKVNDEEEVALYLTPGGIYTEADIKANGGVTASQKFKGVMSSHDMNPKPGDKICPVTLTKANAKFTWVVAGKSYEFCCPPCVDEFLKTAKENPTALKNPEDYVKTR
jgi:YHS domain-containing protein